MPVNNSWIIENKVMLLKMYGDVKVEELHEGAKNSLNVLNQSTHKLHQLIDMSETNSLPSNIAQLGEVSRPVNEHPLMGWVIMYGIKNKLIKFIITMTSHLAKSQLKVADDYESAIAVLKKLDGSLNMELESKVEGNL